MGLEREGNAAGPGAGSAPANGQMLILEPYYGGSHQRFCDALAASRPLGGRVTLWTMPARKWKWRMRFAAPVFAQRLSASRPVELVFASSFVDIATLRGCGPAWLRQVPVVVYFHENQFAYPVQVQDERDLHFAVTNLTSVLAADLALFNSQHNLRTFLAGARDLCRHAPDMRLASLIDRLAERCRVLYPGVDFSDIDQAGPAPRPPASPPIVLWNHRWEHDKGPEEFFAALQTLVRQGVDFQVVILGRGFAAQPAVFASAPQRLGGRLLHCGWVERQEYGRWLQKADVVVSTAKHEFYGMAVLEAVRAGCRPVLPRRLSYPELFPDEYLYPEGEVVPALASALAQGPIDQQTAHVLTARHDWATLRREFAHLLRARQRMAS